MRKFPAPCRQKLPSGDRLFINLPRPEGGYQREYLGLWDDPAAQEEYRRRRELFLLTGEWTPKPKDKVLTVGELSERFLSWASDYYQRDGRRTRTDELYFYAMRTVIDLFGDRPVNDFGLDEMKAVQRWMIERGSLSRKTINQRMMAVRSVFRWGVENLFVLPVTLTKIGLIRPIQKGRYGTYDRPKVKAVPPEDVEATLPHLSSVVAAMVRLQLLTGCRPEEIRIMRPCDFERADPALWIYQPAHDKTEWTRSENDLKWVPIGPKAISILLEHSIHLPDDSQEFIFRPVDALKEKRLRQAGERQSKRTPSQILRDGRRKIHPRERLNDHYSASAYCRVVQRAAAKAGVPAWNPYRLRHTAATECEKECGWRAAQTLLGHKNPDTTRIYVDENRELAERIARERG